MKMKTAKSEKSSGNGLVLSIVKGVAVGLATSLVGILLFAFILRFTSIPDKIIAPVNQVIKGVSIFLGVFLGMKKHKEMGLFAGF